MSSNNASLLDSKYINSEDDDYEKMLVAMKNMVMPVCVWHFFFTHDPWSSYRTFIYGKAYCIKLGL